MISNSNVDAAKKVPEISFASNLISPETDRTDGQLAKKREDKGAIITVMLRFLKQQSICDRYKDELKDGQ